MKPTWRDAGAAVIGVSLAAASLFGVNQVKQCNGNKPGCKPTPTPPPITATVTRTPTVAPTAAPTPPSVGVVDTIVGDQRVQYNAGPMRGNVLVYINAGYAQWHALLPNGRDVVLPFTLFTTYIAQGDKTEQLPVDYDSTTGLLYIVGGSQIQTQQPEVWLYVIDVNTDVATFVRSERISVGKHLAFTRTASGGIVILLNHFTTYDTFGDVHPEVWYCKPTCSPVQAPSQFIVGYAAMRGTVIQRPDDNTVWTFWGADGSGGLAALRFVEQNNSLVFSLIVNNTQSAGALCICALLGDSVAGTDLNGPNGEDPWMYAVWNPVDKKVEVVYQSHNQNGNVQLPGGGAAAPVMVTQFDANGGMTFLPRIQNASAERISKFAYVITSTGLRVLFYFRIDPSTPGFANLQLTETHSSGGFWSTPKNLGVKDSTSNFPGVAHLVNQPVFYARMSDQQLHKFEVK